jgi:hypothetical protein
MTRLQVTFVALVIAQAAHSIEEYFGQLYVVFPPARFVSGLISQNLRLGFIIFNVSRATRRAHAYKHRFERRYG